VGNYLLVNFSVHISTSIQLIILPSRHTASLAAHFPQSLHGSPERPSPIQPSHQVSLADHTRNSTPGRHPPQTTKSVTPCTLKLLDRRHRPDASPTAVRPPRFAQLPLHAGFNQPSFVNRHRPPIDRPPLDLSTQPNKSRLRSSADSSRTNPTWSSPPLRLSVFRGFNILLRGVLSRTWKPKSTLRVHGPLVLGEGEEKISTIMPNEFELHLLAWL